MSLKLHCCGYLSRTLAGFSFWAFVWLSLSLPFQAQSAALVTAELPPAAQQSIAKGLTAAKQQQWLVAIRAFDEARATAPDSPVPLYNLGLAEAQLPGRELRAICWFEAYLALAPNADNADAVREEITRLDARATDTIRNILALLKTYPTPSAFTLARLTALFLIQSNDLNGAVATLNPLEGSYRDSVRSTIAQFFADYRRYPDAIEQAEKIQSESYKASAYASIVTAKTEMGLFADAKSMLEKAAVGKDRGRDYFDALFGLAEAEFEAGKIEESKALMRDSKAFIDTLPDEKIFRIDYAVARYKTGGAEEAKTLLRTIRESMGQFSDVKSVRDSKGKIAISSRVFTDRMVLLCRLATANFKIGQKQLTPSLLLEAGDSAEAGQKAEEYVPIIILNWSYLEIEDWDGLRKFSMRQTKVATQQYKQTADQNADWLAYTEKMIVDAKSSHAIAKAKRAANKALTTVGSSSSQRSHAWSDFAAATLNVPIITNLKATMEGFSSYVPKKSEVFDTSVFGKVTDQAEFLLGRLGDVHLLQARQIELVGRN